MFLNLITWWIFSLVKTNKVKQRRKFWLNNIYVPPKYAECVLKYNAITMDEKGIYKVQDVYFLLKEIKGRVFLNNSNYNYIYV